MPRGGGPASPVRCFGSEGEQSVAEEKPIKTKVEMPRGGGPASPVRCVCSNGRQSIAEKLERPYIKEGLDIRFS